MGACVGEDLGAASPSSLVFFPSTEASPSWAGTIIGLTITSPEDRSDCRCISPLTKVTSLSSPGAWTGVCDAATAGTMLAGAGTAGASSPGLC